MSDLLFLQQFFFNFELVFIKSTQGYRFISDFLRIILVQIENRLWRQQWWCTRKHIQLKCKICLWMSPSCIFIYLHFSPSEHFCFAYPAVSIEDLSPALAVGRPQWHRKELLQNGTEGIRSWRECFFRGSSSLGSNNIKCKSDLKARLWPRYRNSKFFQRFCNGTTYIFSRIAKCCVPYERRCFVQSLSNFVARYGCLKSVTGKSLSNFSSAKVSARTWLFVLVFFGSKRGHNKKR